MTVTIDDNKRRQTPGYNKANNTIDGRMTEVTPHPMELSGKKMFEKGFFTGVESALGIDDYPTMEIENCHHRNSSNNATISTLMKSDVYQAMEARDTTNKKQEVWEKKLTTQEQPCKNCFQEGHNYVHKDINKDFFH